MKDIIIAVDGHSSCGKSTVAKQIAKSLNYRYIDTGAMYRMVTLYAIRMNYINDKIIDTEKLYHDLDNIEMDFRYNKQGKQESYLNGENVESEIRNMTVSNKVSYISELSEVRTKLVDIQRKMGSQKRIVMDGRDIGTVVFPNAELKIFLTASEEVRAQRRYDELIAKNEDVSFDEILKNVKDRDYIDQNRAVGPLKQAEDAILVDNSNLNREEQFNLIMKLIEEKIN